MSSSFSFSRLTKLIKKQFFENSRFYGFSLLALAGLLALVFTFWISATAPNYHEEGTWMIFLFGLFLSGSVFASMSFNMIGSKDRGIYWLGIPATHFEKLVCTIFYTTVLFVIVYCLCFFSIKAIAMMFIKALMAKDPNVSYTEMNGLNHGFGEVIPYFICGFFAVQALYLLGSVYFSRYAFVVTTVVGALVFFVFGYYISKIDDNMFDGFSWDFISLKKFNPDADGYQNYEISSSIAKPLQYVVQFLWAPLFWLITWYRLKEKEL